MTDLKACLEMAIPAALEAGRAILEVYGDSASCTVETKADNSPLTCADRASHEVIMRFLGQTPYPVLSEEGRAVPHDERSTWNPLWIVDPLDGTKEFIKRNGEFTVNIALVENHVPVCGVIYVPVTGALYFAAQGLGAWKVQKIEEFSGLAALMGDAVRLPVADGRRSFVIMGSRSHASPELLEFVEQVRATHDHVELVSAGSSLKICLVAEGAADVYPRTGPTMEWDTAAGHAIARCSGKEMTDWGTGEALRYNKSELLNPWFIVR